jgi:hypothetical protein
VKGGTRPTPASATLNFEKFKYEYKEQ